MDLDGYRIALLAATGVHDHEFWYPFYRFREAGAEVVVAGPRTGTILGEGRHGSDGLPIRVERTVEEIAGTPFDLVYLPGGLYHPLALRNHEPALDLVRRTIEDGGLVAAICHAPWILISAGVVEGRRIACPRDMADDVTNAGGIFVDEPAVQDGPLLTSVFFGYLPEHFRLIVPALRRRGPRHG